MGFIARVISFARTIRDDANLTLVESDLGGDVVSTATNYSAPGDDSPPMPDDYAAIMSTTATGNSVVVGYVDLVNAGEAAAGEKRFYSRNADGEVMGEVWLYLDGAITIANENGNVRLDADGAITLENDGIIELKPNGEINLNGATISTDGTITAPVIEAQTSLTAAGLELVGHTHLAGDPPGTTGPNI